ncbi:MAG: dehydratase [Candidatus Hydrogenedentota bacterium]|nr:MAG: dehydratase [Candidatus Hydrogenedentota bacterium]
MENQYKKRGLYYEDFELGQSMVTQGRTVTEADIVNFCGFTGDWSELHTNAEYAKTIPFKQRIAHGMLTMSMATGLAVLTGMIEGTILAFEGIEKWEFVRPVFIGDTVHVELTPIAKEIRPLRGGIRAGRVSIEAKVKKQNGKVCQKGIWNMLILCRNES